MALRNGRLFAGALFAGALLTQPHEIPGGVGGHGRGFSEDELNQARQYADEIIKIKQASTAAVQAVDSIVIDQPVSAGEDGNQPAYPTLEYPVFSSPTIHAGVASVRDGFPLAHELVAQLQDQDDEEALMMILLELVS